LRPSKDFKLMSIEILPTQPSMRVIGSSVFSDELTRITAAPRADRTLPIVGAAMALANSRTFRPESGRLSCRGLSGQGQIGFELYACLWRLYKGSSLTDCPW
jgi:hypothetical protein